ncbi:MAG: efflux RND transporter periplasmic adaptor subunit [Woeseia sp.]|nr:efflux RND transporter periplasmic adaptor subunit [Woeseia sp.]NNL54837.1 efflux RND transporter periplasmic adaptor subunit [Woeseia sp.]
MTLLKIVAPAMLLCGTVAVAQVPVEVAPLSSQLVELEIRAPATVVPANRAVVAAQVGALISEVLVDVGSIVDKGDELIRLDQADASLAAQRAEAELNALDSQIAQAERQLTRGEELFASNYISDDELLVRRTNVAVLTANRAAQQLAIRSAKLALSRTSVRAPFAAAVVERAAQVGSLAQPGTPLITLVQVSNREVDAELDPRNVASIESAAELRFESQGSAFPVTVSRLSPIVETDSRIQRGRFRFVEATAPIGASGEVVWRDAAGLLPITLIVQRDQQLGVFVADGQKARFMALPMAQEGRPARANLPPDTLLVVRGQSRLQDGDELSFSRP